MAYSAEQRGRLKWSISASRNIAASPDNIWAAIANPGNLEDCHPFWEKNPEDAWYKVDSKVTIHYFSGWVLHREFTNWIDRVGYDLPIGREGGRKSFVS